MQPSDVSVQVSTGTRIVGVPWNTFLRWIKDSWLPGQHFALVGPTGEGKTTFAVGILSTRKWVMALDPKGEDDTLAASGYTRITSFPLPRKMRRDLAEKKPMHLIIGGASDTVEGDRALRNLLSEAIEITRQQGGWTLYADEYQVLADLRMFGLGKPVERLIITSRGKGTSVVTAFQAPAWVPKAATRQATFVAIWPTRDRAMIRAVAEGMGRTADDLETAVHMLPPYHVLIIPKRIHAPMVITLPPAIN